MRITRSVGKGNRFIFLYDECTFLATIGSHETCWANGCALVCAFKAYNPLENRHDEKGDKELEQQCIRKA